jgi:hypothetical protein
MVAVLLIGGIGLLLAGLLAIGFGIPVKEFSFGNTLILTGAIVACTGVMMLALWIVVRELKIMARQMPAGSRVGSALPLSAALDDEAAEDDGFPFSRDQPAVGYGGIGQPAAQPPPWLEEVGSRDRGRGDAPAPEQVEAASAARQRRNLMFSSSSRKERERAEARTAEPFAADTRLAAPGFASPAAPPAAELGEAPPATFDDAWPKSERARAGDAPLPRRGGRTPLAFTEAGAGAAGADRYPPAARSEGPPQVTVIKSGVVDGMAYSLYSDGSIEAQMPEGTMRFASIDELRAHLGQRP